MVKLNSKKSKKSLAGLVRGANVLKEKLPSLIFDGESRK
jgi:hypothetical protein